jgi:AraC family transcriptional regulator
MSLVPPSPHSIPSEHGRNAILARLLSDAVAALERDTERVRTSLSRAVALVEEAPASASCNRRGSLTSWQAQKTISLIDEQLEEGTRNTELAANVRLSQSHFSRAFKSSFGCSPQQFVLKRRVERAQELMLTTDSRLSDIAQACGFADQAHFSRMFNRLVGRPPNAWRRARGSASNFSL